MHADRHDLRCRGCGYGIVVAGPPPPCPLCRSSNWAPLPQHMAAHDFPDRRGLRRGRAVGLSFAIFVVALVAFAYLLLTPLIDETRRFVDDLPQLLEDLTHGNGRLGFLEDRFQIVERARAAVDSAQLGAT